MENMIASPEMLEAGSISKTTDDKRALATQILRSTPAQ